MNSNATDAVIVSAFGRGHWLAAELVSHGVSVSLLDVSDQLGRWSPEDIEGPFGYFQAPALSLSQKARLDEEDYSELVDDGFVLWLKNGPIDMRGPHAPYVLEQAGIDADMLDYVGNYDELPAKRRNDLVKKWESEPFSRNWFVNFAHSLSSPCATINRDSIKYSRPLPLTSPYAVRRVSRRGFEKSLQWVEALGVKVFTKSKMKQFTTERREIHGFEIEGHDDAAKSDVLWAEQVVWCLTSAETKQFLPKFFERLFPNGELQPQWIWMRFRVNLTRSNVTDSLPLKFVVLDDVGLRWSHANLIWMQRTTSSEIFDAWVRLPAVHRFQRAYLEAMGREIAVVLNQRLPGVDVNVAELPQEVTYEPSELGPAHYQVFDPKDLARFRPKAFRNLHYDGPETWQALDWSARMRTQNEIAQTIIDWKKQRQLAMAKKNAANNVMSDRAGGPL